MKIACLLGSPRSNGNSTSIARIFCNELTKENPEVKYFELNKLNYKGCQACDACKNKSEHCVLKDDMAEVLKSVEESDLIILASPVYYGDVTSQLKAFIDRTYSYLVPDYKTKMKKNIISRLKPNKKIVMILTQLAPEEHFSDIFPKYKFLFEMFLGIKEVSLIRECNLDKKNDVINNLELVKRVEKIAQDFYL